MRGNLRLNMDDGFGWRRTFKIDADEKIFYEPRRLVFQIDEDQQTFGALIERVEGEGFEPSVPANGSLFIG